MLRLRQVDLRCGFVVESELLHVIYDSNIIARVRILGETRTLRDCPTDRGTLRVKRWRAKVRFTRMDARPARRLANRRRDLAAPRSPSRRSNAR